MVWYWALWIVKRVFPVALHCLQKVPVWCWAYSALTELETQQHDYQTVAIDSLDWLERLIWDAVCRRESAQNTRHAPQLGNLGCLGVLTQPQTGDPNKEKIRRKDQPVPFGIKLGRHGKFQAARRRSEV